MEKQKLPGTFELIVETKEIFTRRAGLFVAISLLPFAILAILALCVALIKKTGTPVSSLEAFAQSLPGIIVFSLLAIGIFGFCYAMLLAAVAGNQKKISFKESFRRAWSLMPSLIWIMFLTISIVYGGVILLVIPAIIFSFWILLAPFVLASENVRGMQALLKSREYVRGYWWALFGRYMLISLFFSVLCFIPFLNILVFILLWPFVMIFYYLIYEHLKRIKGTVSLESTPRHTKIVFIIASILGFLVVSLGVFGLPSLAGARSKARDAIRVTDAQNIQLAVTYYAQDTGQYPPNIEDDVLGAYFEYGEVPVDPQSYESYSYVTDGKKYQIAVELETDVTKLGEERAGITSADLAGAKDGSSTTCTSAPWDCVFDLGKR